MSFDPNKLTYSGLARFAEAVHTVMEANDITARQRRDLICYWAYQYQRPDMLRQLDAAIKRCQADADSPEFQITATCRINAVTGEETAFNPPVYR